MLKYFEPLGIQQERATAAATVNRTSRVVQVLDSGVLDQTMIAYMEARNPHHIGTWTRRLCIRPLMVL